MFNVGTGEMVVILVAALLLLGPERLPELARGIGKFMREFRKQTEDVRGMVEKEFYRMDLDITADSKAPLPGLPANASPLHPALPGLAMLKPLDGVVARDLRSAELPAATENPLGESVVEPPAPEVKPRGE